MRYRGYLAKGLVDSHIVRFRLPYVYSVGISINLRGRAGVI